MSNYTNENNESVTILLEELIERLWDYTYSEKETTNLSIMLSGEMYTVCFSIDEGNINLGDGIDIDCNANSFSINEKFVVDIIKEEDELEGLIYTIVLANETTVYFTFWEKTRKIY